MNNLHLNLSKPYFNGAINHQQQNGCEAVSSDAEAVNAAGIQQVGEKAVSPLNVFADIVENKRLPEFYHTFNSEIFSTYHSQLQTFVNEKLDPTFLERLQLRKDDSLFFKDAYSLIELINKELPKDPTERRNIHENSLVLLRSLIWQKGSLNENDPLVKETNEFVNAICVWMYTKPDLLQPMQRFLGELSQEPITDLAEQDYSKLIENYFKSLKENQSLTHSYEISEEFADNHYSGSLPFTLYTIGNTHLIYTSRATIETKDKKISIIPEFKNYLLALKSEGKTHLYINLMNRLGDVDDKKDKVSNRVLSSAIENLERDPEISDAIMVLTIDKNSDFYNQRNAFEKRYDDENNAELLKQDLMVQMFKPEGTSPFKWPSKLDLDQWKITSQDVLENVHQTFFAGKDNLNAEERKVFIELCLTKMIKSLHDELKPNFSNMTCKHSMDRGPSTYGLFYVLDKFESQGSLTQKDMETFLTLFFTPSILVHNRGITSDRFKTFFLVYNHLAKHFAQ